MEEFLFESIEEEELKRIKIGESLEFCERNGFGNFAHVRLNKKGGFFIYLFIETLNENKIQEFKICTPEFRIFTKGDKSYMLINFSPNFPILEFLFDVSIYKNFLNSSELGEVLKNNYQIALVDENCVVKAVKEVKAHEDIYRKFEKGLVKAFNNPNFSKEYRLFLLPFYEKSADRWWNILKEV